MDLKKIKKHNDLILASNLTFRVGCVGLVRKYRFNVFHETWGIESKITLSSWKPFLTVET